MPAKNKPNNSKFLVIALIEHFDPSLFAQAILDFKAQRMFMFASPGYADAAGAIPPHRNISFIDKKGNVHHIVIYNNSVNQSQPDPETAITKAAEKAGIPIYEGVIKIFPAAGCMYEIFNTDTPEDEGAKQCVYDAYLAAVKELPAEKTTITHEKLPDGDTCICVRHEYRYLMTFLDNKGTRTLENTLASLAGRIAKTYATAPNHKIAFN